MGSHPRRIPEGRLDAQASRKRVATEPEALGNRRAPRTIRTSLKPNHPMSKQTIDFRLAFPCSVSVLYARLSDHERLGDFWPGKFVLIQPAPGPDKNGAGAVRRIRVAGSSFEETVLRSIPNQLIEYTVSRGGPVKNHLGTMRFAAQGSGCELHYTITFESKLPLAGPLIKFLLAGPIIGGLKKLSASYVQPGTGSR